MDTLTRGSFAKGGSSLSLNTGGWRTSRPEHHPQVAPCSFNCPAGENPQTYLARIAEGDHRTAWEAIVDANPLPAITGRVCPHPCESGCNRGKYDESIAIHSVERFLGDRAIVEGWEYPIKPSVPDALQVAVVGAGPAGLSAAYHLLCAGYRVSVFEAEPQAGGVLRSALPPYRLPRAVLDAELKRLLALPMDFRPNNRVGRDVSLEELQKDFRAVFLGPGANQPIAWSVDGATPTDHRSGFRLLQEWISVGALPAYKRVAIIGGGNSAIDLARVLKFLGASEVHVVTFQSMLGPGVDPHEAMSATPREIQQAIEEGVTIHTHRGIKRLILRAGALIGAELVHMRELPTADGGRKPVEFEGTETILMVDQVIPSIGQEVERAGFEQVLAAHPFFQCDEFGQLTAHSGIFAGGDACHSGGSVSGAIGEGRRAALAIDRYLRGLPITSAAPIHPIAIEALNLSYFEPSPRAQPAILPVVERTIEQEIEASLAHDQIDHEAHRCFSCGECMSCDNCWTLCPDNSVLKVPPSPDSQSNYVFDYDHCKGCGICAHECPVGYIAMVKET